MPKMFEAGLHGRKAKKGFYNYAIEKGRLRKTSPNQDAYQHFEIHLKLSPKKIDRKEIEERTMLMLLNEAVWCLEDNILQNPKDGDIGGVFNYLSWFSTLVWRTNFSYMNLFVWT